MTLLLWRYCFQENWLDTLRLHLPVEAWSDSWALTHWVLVDVLDDASQWIAAALTRNEPSIVSRYGINVCNFTLNRRFLRLLKKRPMTMLSEWMRFIEKIGSVVGPDSLNDEYVVSHFQKPQLIIPPLLAPISESFLNGLFPWVKFLGQQNIKAYYNSNEGIGVLSRIHTNQGESIDELSGRLHYVGVNIARMRFPDGMRWSFFGDCYMSGPISIINCSCSNHRNVNMRPRQRMQCDGAVMEVVVEWCVEPGDKLYAAYSNDTQDMLDFRGIRCRVCLK